MLQLDDVQLYDLSEAGALLFSDPARLRRQARLRQVPAARVAEKLGLPAPWVDAASGRSGADAISLRTYWLERLAPPPADVRRPRRERARLPSEALLDAETAARRLFATPPALTRLTEDGSLPALRVEGEVRYDETLVDLLARAQGGEDVEGDVQARRADVRSWARFEYEAEAAPVTPPAPEASAPPAFAFPEPETPSTPSPGAYEIPKDLGMDDIQPLELDEPTSGLIEAEGFETVDEDEFED